MHQNFISLALLIATTLVAGFFAYIYSIKRQAYLLFWTSGWTVFGLHYLGQALAQGTQSSALENSLDHWLYTLSGLLFFLGAQIYSQRKPWKIPAGSGCKSPKRLWPGGIYSKIPPHCGQTVMGRDFQR